MRHLKLTFTINMLICIAFTCVAEIPTPLWEYKASTEWKGIVITGIQQDEIADITTLEFPLTIEVEGEKQVVVEIAAEAFKNYPQLTNVVISDNIKYIGEKAFAKCKNLRNVTLGDGLLEMGEGVFAGCRFEVFNLIRNQLISGMGNAFTDCDITDCLFTISPYHAEAFLQDNPINFKDFTLLNVWSLGGPQYPIYLSYNDNVLFDEFNKFILGDLNKCTILANKNNDVNIGWSNELIPGPRYIWPSYNRIEFTNDEIKPIFRNKNETDPGWKIGEYVSVRLDKEVNTFKIHVIPMGNYVDSLNQEDSNNVKAIYNSNGVKLNTTDVNTLPHGIYFIVTDSKVHKYLK